MTDDLRQSIDDCWAARERYEAAYRDLVEIHSQTRRVVAQHFGVNAPQLLLPIPPEY